MSKIIYIGTDGGATTSKVGGVWSDGTTISTKLLQSSTNSIQGTEAVVNSWVESINTYQVR
jgi:activator of 2-hydroxyglutaryl-CoA dehydratase